VDINFLKFNEGVWTYQTHDQKVLVANCIELLNWDLFRYDCWLFGSSKWTMYTRRRQQLIELRTGLATGWKRNANDLASQKLMIADFAMQSWGITRAKELRGLAEVQELGCAYREAKSVRRKLLPEKLHLQGEPKGHFSTARLMPHALMLSDDRTLSV
jgi:hypothetical protein